MGEIKTILISGGGKQFDDDDDVAGVYITKSVNHFFLIRVSKIKKRADKMTYMISVSPTPHNHAKQIPDVDDSTCLQITVKSSSEKIKAHIDFLNHENICSMCRPLERKTGTYEMVVSTLSFCYELFGTEKFSLYDASSFLCGPEELKITMRHHNLLVHGKSWYERTFGAIPVKREDRVLWSDAQSRMREIADTETVIDIVNMAKGNIPRPQRKPIMDILKNNMGSSSWIEIFQKINNLEDDKGCIFFRPIIMNIIGDEDTLNIPRVQDWVINIDPNDNSETLLDSKRIY